MNDSNSTCCIFISFMALLWLVAIAKNAPTSIKTNSDFSALDSINLTEKKVNQIGDRSDRSHQINHNNYGVSNRKN